MSLAALRRGIQAMGDAADPPATGRIGATLVLVTPAPDDELTVTYTRRQWSLSSHPGQISFPGGRVDPGESIEQAAIREAREEIGLRPDSITVLGRLPAFYIPPSRFWMAAVVASWDHPHDLLANTAEVGEIIALTTDRLRDPATWRSVPLTGSGLSWAWALGPDRLLWGATAVMTAVVLRALDPGWSGGVAPEDLGPDRQVRPWEDVGPTGRPSAPMTFTARLRDVPVQSVPVTRTGEADPFTPGLADHQAVEAAAGDLADAVSRLHRRGEGPVVVLVGRGNTGRVAAATTRRLRESGEEVTEIGADGRVYKASGSDRDAGTAQAEVDRVIAGAGVIIDGFLGTGLSGVLRDPLQSLVAALSHSGAPLVSIDLPSGMDPLRGLIGPTVSADVTVAIGALRPGHVSPGALPFVGDLYLSRPGHGLVRATPPERPGLWAE